MSESRQQLVLRQGEAWNEFIASEPEVTNSPEIFSSVRRPLRWLVIATFGVAAFVAIVVRESRGSGQDRHSTANGLELPGHIIEVVGFNDAGLEEPSCHTAKHGERCHTDVVYAMRNRQLHPEWYIGLDNCSTFEDFQTFMSNQVLNSGGRRCPKPCRGPGKKKRDCKEDDAPEDKECHTAVPGDKCYAHMIYTQKEAIKYPRWYPGLSAESTLKEVQHYLKEEKVCPEPCGLDEVVNKSKALAHCHTALPGETCFQDVVLAKEHFIVKHPDWYPGLTNESTRDEFQAFLHNQHDGEDGSDDGIGANKACPNPCNKDVVEDMEIRFNCETATLGDACYESVAWGATKGIVDHPEWYPGLAENSTFEDFQLKVSKDNHTHCQKVPCPCHTAQRGEKCYWSILWVLRTGISKYPKTFEGLSSTSSLEEVQQHLYVDGTSTCGRPCATFPDSPWTPTFLPELQDDTENMI